MARVYAERAYAPVHGCGDRNNKIKLPLNIEPDKAALYGEVIAVAARISIANKNMGEAVSELEQATKLDPQNAEYRQLLEVCRADRQNNRRRIQAREDRRRNHELDQCKIIRGM